VTPQLKFEKDLSVLYIFGNGHSTVTMNKNFGQQPPLRVGWPKTFNSDHGKYDLNNCDFNLGELSEVRELDAAQLF
jgi:hypothetical protein